MLWLVDDCFRCRRVADFYRVLVDGINHRGLQNSRSEYIARRIEEYEQTIRNLAASLHKASFQLARLRNNI